MRARTPFESDARALVCPQPFIRALAREAKSVEYNESPDAPQSNRCVGLLARKAVSQLKRADLTPGTPPAGIPASVVPSNREFDPVLSSLSKLATLIAPLDEQLALEVLDEVIAAANASALDTAQARTGLDAELFRQLSLRNEVRVRQAAESLKDRLRRIVALAAIHQSTAAGLAQAAKK
ncbi:MAG: hypothetical protein QOG71_642 [Pyrinomonadaceae bacterium]|nr:hypothetical protein [Pyrinomonadaceae bacterium]